MSTLGKGIRVCVFTANSKLIFECATKREASKVRTTWRVACDMIDEANLAYEKKLIDKYEYYCRCQAAIAMCSVGFTASLSKRAKYLGSSET